MYPARTSIPASARYEVLLWHSLQSHHTNSVSNNVIALACAFHQWHYESQWPDQWLVRVQKTAYPRLQTSECRGSEVYRWERWAMFFQSTVYAHTSCPCQKERI